jgi:hypothetical protein
MANTSVPVNGTKRFEQIVSLGCGGYYQETSDGTEFDCDHGYDWDCENCPCFSVSHERVCDEIPQRICF